MALLLGNTSALVESPLRDGADVYAPPLPVRLDPAERRAAVATAAEFLETAVRREHAERAYDLVAPSLRGGTSRADWRRGEIPVVPYPVDGARWRFEYSYSGAIGLQVAVFPERGSTLRPMVFDLSLRAFGRGEARRWLVDAWSPRGSGGGARASRAAGSPFRIGPAPPSAAPRLGAVWLLLPAGLFALALLVAPAVVARDRLRSRRAERAYQNSSSSPS